MKTKNVREVCLDVLIRVEKNKSYSNLELNRALNRVELSLLDRKLATEIVYGTISRQNTIDFILSPLIPRGLSKLDPWVRELLRMSTYQLIFLQNIPAHAVVHEAVEIVKRRGRRNVAAFVNAVLRNVIRHPERIESIENMNDVVRIALKHSHPEWLVRRWLKYWDKPIVENLCAANNTPPRHSLRVNTMKISREALKAAIEREAANAHIVYSDISPDGLICEGLGNVGNSTWARDGLCTVQDESAMLVSHVVNPEPGGTVLDMCAAPGGKTTHLAELMHGEGTVVACDLYEHRTRLIKKQAQRLQLSNITVMECDARKLPEVMASKFDFVLLDAPCSGFGVMRRKPEIKWRRTETDIEQLVTLQRELLDAAVELVKVGGVLVYSTCTVEIAENERQIQRFLDKHTNFELDEGLDDLLSEKVIHRSSIGRGMVRIFPQHFQSDGFFIARMRRVAL